MSDREKKLLIAVLAVLVFWGATQGLDRYRNALAKNQEIKLAAEKELASKKMDVARGLDAQMQVNLWRKHSLPTNVDIAESLYQDWLRQLLDDAGLKTNQLTSRSSAFDQSKYYKQHSFVIEADGKLASLIQFLHGFYEAGHLHRISKATLIPMNDRQELSINLTVDAIALNDCRRTDTLSTHSLTAELPEFEHWKERIASRNVFALYKPPAPPVQEPEAIASHEEPASNAKELRLSSMTQSDSGWRMSVFNSTSGDLLYYEEGDEIELGNLKGTIERLDARRAIIVTESARLQLRLGQSFDQAQPLTDSAS